VSAEIGEVLDHIDMRAYRQRIAVLVTGDPGLFSLAKPVIERFGRTRCRVIPGVSSVQTAFARIGVTGPTLVSSVSKGVSGQL